MAKQYKIINYHAGKDKTVVRIREVLPNGKLGPTVEQNLLKDCVQKCINTYPPQTIISANDRFNVIGEKLGY